MLSFFSANSCFLFLIKAWDVGFFVGFWVYAACDRFPNSRSGHYTIQWAYWTLRNEMERSEIKRNKMERNKMERNEMGNLYFAEQAGI